MAGVVTAMTTLNTATPAIIRHNRLSHWTETQKQWHNNKQHIYNKSCEAVRQDCIAHYTRITTVCSCALQVVWRSSFQCQCNS